MSTSLVDLLPGAEAPGSIRIWLKSSAYAQRLLLGEAGDPWSGASQYLAFFSQAQGLLKPDVAVLEVGELFDSWVGRNPGLREELAGKKRLSFAPRKLLEQAGPRQILAEVGVAVLANLRGQVPLVLSMPSPRAWAIRANALAGRDCEELADDLVEDVAMYVADLMRSVSALAVGGVMLEENQAEGHFGAVQVELYRPIINVAKHYRWALGLRTGAAEIAGNEALDEFNWFLSKRASLRAGVPLGVDVSEVLWRGAPLPELRPGQFYFVEIPRDASPELVLDNLARLRK